MNNDILRVCIQEKNSFGGHSNTNPEFKNLQELVDYLKKEGISKVSLKHGAFAVDFDITRKDNISIDELTEDDFIYLTEDKPGYFMFLVVERKVKS